MPFINQQWYLFLFVFERFNGFIVDGMNNLSRSYKNKLETNENSLSSMKRGKWPGIGRGRNLLMGCISWARWAGAQAPHLLRMWADPPQTGLTWLLTFRHFLLILHVVLFPPSRSPCRERLLTQRPGRTVALQLCTQCFPWPHSFDCQRTAAVL